jgi:peptidoglycan/LPS O-acetylase OafA/YrhL
MARTSNSGREEIVPLTSLRGIAAMAVIAMHFSATMQEVSTGPFPSLAPHAELAVDVFFVLSGFIMAYTYLPSFSPQNSWRAYRQFLVKRMARILPLNVFVVTAVTLLAFATSSLLGENLFPRARMGNLGVDLAANALMLPGLGIGWSLNWPAWSVSVEFVAYFLFPLGLVFVFRSGRYGWLASCLSALIAIGLVCATGPDWSPDGLHNHPFPVRDIVRCLSEFLLGLAVFRAYQSGLFKIFAKDAVAVGAGAAVILVILLRLPELLAVLVFPALILALSLNNGLVAKFMSLPFLRFLGLISYSLYLVHDNFRNLAAKLVMELHHGPVSPSLGISLAALCTGLMIFPAWATYVWVEKPGRSLRTRRFRWPFPAGSRV